MQGHEPCLGPAADRKEMAELLDYAVDAGCTFFDTAESCGFEAIPTTTRSFQERRLPPSGTKIRIAMKFGIALAGMMAGRAMPSSPIRVPPRSAPPSKAA